MEVDPIDNPSRFTKLSTFPVLEVMEFPEARTLIAGGDAETLELPEDDEELVLGRIEAEFVDPEVTVGALVDVLDRTF